jgi:RND family efflux transporter MFP subunit
MIVEVAEVGFGSLALQQHFSGSLEFNQKSRLAAQSSGAITKLYFDKADHVKKGQLLLDIDAEILEAKIEALKSEFDQAKLKLELAEKDFKRYAALFKQESIAKQKFDTFFYQKEQALHAVRSLEANLKAEQIALAKKHLYASFEGVIVSRDVQKGEWVKEGDTVALLVNPKRIDLLFHLPQDYLNRVKAGSVHDVEINKRHYKAKVIGRLLEGDVNTRTFPLILRLQSQSENFFEGMQVGMALDRRGSQKHTIVPRDAIVRKQTQTFVYFVDKDKAIMEPVTVVSSRGKKVAVKSERLHKGMKVIIKGNERLYPNAKIRIQ